jgi:hypothetical protein
VKRPEREADHSPPSSAKFKNDRSITSTFPPALVACIVDDFTRVLVIGLYEVRTSVWGGGALPLFRSWPSDNDGTNTIRTEEASEKHTELMSNEMSWKVKGKNFCDVG